MGKRKPSNSVAAQGGYTNARVPMGTSAYTLADVPSSSEFNKGMVVQKAGGGVGRPDAATAVPRHGVAHRTNGPRMSISVGLPGPQAPEATLNQGNARTIPSTTRRSVDSFMQGRLY